MSNRILWMLLFSGIVMFGRNGRAQEMITDTHFQRGVNAKGLVPTETVLGPLQFTTANGAPFWGMAEWYSKQTIYGTTPIVRPSGAYRWSNSYKHATLGPVGTDDSDAILYVDSIAEYGGVYRTSSGTWPHLLVDQKISSPGGGAANYAPWLSDLDELRINIDARLNSAYNYYGSGYNSTLHAAQFVVYFTVQYLQTGQTGYGDYLWFGLKFYDDRYTKPGLYANWDGGTSKYIYNIGIPFTDTGLTLGQWKTISGDLLPHIKTAFNAARAAGALPYSGNLADYKIGGMNMGWEVPGLSRVEMQVRNFSLMYAPIGWSLINDRTVLATTANHPDFPVHYANNGNTGSPATRIGLPLSGSTGFRKTDSGLLMLEAANHSISGAVDVAAGILGVSTNDLSLPNVDGITVQSGAQLLLGEFVSGTQAKTMRIAAPVTIAGNGPGNFGALFTRGDKNTGEFEGPVTLAGDARIGTYGVVNTNRFTGGLGGSGTLTLRGQGTSTSFFGIESPFTHQGDTVLASLNANLIVRLYGADYLPTNTVLRLEPENATRGTTLQLNGFDQTLAGLSSNTSAWRRVVNNSATAATLTINDAGNRTFSGTLGNSTANEKNFGVVKTGSGFWTLSGANTYSGSTLISKGRIIVANGNALGGTAAGTTVDSGANLTLQDDITVNEPLIIAGTAGGSTIGVVRNLSGNNTLGGNIDLTANATIVSSAGLLSINGAIDSNTRNLDLRGAGDMAVNGVISGTGTYVAHGDDGTLTLSGLNTFSGQMRIDRGVVVANTLADTGTASSLGKGGSAPIRMGWQSNSGGMLRYTGGAASTDRRFQMGYGSLATHTASGGIENNGTGALNFTAAAFNSRETTATAARTLALGGSNAGGNTIQGIIADNHASNGGMIGLVKTGAGKWILSGNNTFSGGTTVSAGTLVANADGALGTNDVSVADGATLVLQGGSSNNYIGDLADLVLGSTAVLGLDFTGEDIIKRLSLDGGATWVADGIYNASTLNSLGSGTYTGTGALNVGGVGYAGWASNWGVALGATTDDYDNDGLPNVYEYGLGGDPTNPANQGIPPAYGIQNVGGTNYFGYIHPQLSDPDSGIGYYLELNTNLLLGVWTNDGYMVLGTNVTGGTFNYVTNTTSTVDGKKFIRLIIE
ncbi:MAG: autotransporter-associated beta strand repeat-containing protein [Kiritimatiellales bacterium]|nr:autotransporter-associated beta strand repeat-containing protein [Kiritimatiellales bacterium]